MGTKWTPERKQRQRDLINKIKPWEKSTGPKTPGGKERSSLNALKHGLRAQPIDHLRRALRLNSLFLKEIESHYATNELYKKCKKLF